MRHHPLRPDDDVYRIDAVWLGPRGLTFPWVARYRAYGIALGFFTAILTVEAVTPLDVGLPPVWEFCWAVLGTHLVMLMVDHERPLRSVPTVLWSEARRWHRDRPAKPTDVQVRAQVRLTAPRRPRRSLLAGASQLAARCWQRQPQPRLPRPRLPRPRTPRLGVPAVVVRCLTWRDLPLVVLFGSATVCAYIALARGAHG